MSPNILSQIEQWINEAEILDDKAQNLLMIYLRTNDFKKGRFIHPGVLMRKVKLSSEKAYEILNLLNEKGILQQNFELYCHECDKYSQNLYEYYNDIPRSIECEGCGDELKREKNVIVVYKVIIDGE